MEFIKKIVNSQLLLLRTPFWGGGGSFSVCNSDLVIAGYKRKKLFCLLTYEILQISKISGYKMKIGILINFPFSKCCCISCQSNVAPWGEGRA